jgi:aspartyl protease family protein
MESFFQQFPLPYVLAVAGGLIALMVLSRVPFIGSALRVVFSVAMIGVLVLVLSERASIDPYFGQVADRFNLGGQVVVGKEVRIKMAPNGHFFADVRLGEAKRRMMIDSGATVTAISAATAKEAGLKRETNLVPVILQTANGAVRADTATVPELKVGNIVARDIKVVVSPAFGNMDVIGMNFLSKLQSWRVEGDTLVLVPHHPQPEAQQTR